MSDPNAVTHAQAYEKAAIRLSHIDDLLTLVRQELSQVPTIVGDAELLKALGHCRDLKYVVAELGREYVVPAFGKRPGELVSTIRVKIEFTVEVDVKAWVETYGPEPTAKAVREDVRNYFINYVPESPLGQTEDVRLV